jgi:hypothetical protein
MVIPTYLINKRCNFDCAVGIFYFSCMLHVFIISLSNILVVPRQFVSRGAYESDLELTAHEIVLVYLLCCQYFNSTIVSPASVSYNNLFCLVFIFAFLFYDLQHFLRHGKVC